MRWVILILFMSAPLVSEPIKIKQGKDFFKEGRYLSAINEFNDYLLLFPNSKEQEMVLNYIAKSYIKMGNFPLAIEYYKRLFGYVKDKQKAAYYYYLAGKYYIHIGYFEEAKSIFNEIIQNFPNSKAAFYSQRDLLIIELEEKH